MKRFIQTADRTQATLFPEQLDDYVADETVKVLFHQPHDIMYSIDKYNELYINMTSRRYKTVSNRQQISLLPPSIEDYVHETNPVRAIDAM